MDLTRTFYKLPIGNIPLGEIPSLESLSYDYILCSSISLTDLMGLDYCLISVYNVFDDQFGSINDLTKETQLFGDVLSESLPVRGKYKCLKVGAQFVTISVAELPDLKYSPDNLYSNEGRWFYTKEGNYFVLKAIKSQFENVKHLEGITLYGENILRLRVVIEMLKNNVRKGVVNLTIDEYKDIAYKVLKSDPVMSRTDVNLLKDGVDNWVPPMLMMPLYSNLPESIRGKALQ